LDKVAVAVLRGLEEVVSIWVELWGRLLRVRQGNFVFLIERD
jgi:hypothetical protein